MGPFPKYLTFRNVLVGMFSIWAIGIILKLAWWWYLLVFMVALTISYLGTTQIGSNFHMPAFCNLANCKNKVIAITFDDGVSKPEQSEKVLDILKQYNIPATFFCIGKNLVDETQIKVLKRIDTEGHIIGNHSYSHSAFYDFYSSNKIEKDTLKTDRLIEQYTGKKPLFYRPPYGITTPNIAKAINRIGHKTIGWSLRSLDTVIKDPNTLINRIKHKLKNGDILLFHDHVSYMPAFLPLFLEYILKEGYMIIGVDELLDLRPYEQLHSASL
ncbi:MAG: polysaccharide deacetylase family protein [Saprospiraceae bacterium]|nr:polysaccharide deacetylase family protein [Saprospiraceae bacterium]